MYTVAVLMVDGDAGSIGRVMMKYRGEPNQAQFKDSEELRNPEITTHVAVPEDIDIDRLDVSVSNGVITLSESDPLIDELMQKLQDIRDLRTPKLERVDILSNVAYLNDWTAEKRDELRDYRVALLGITEDYKDDLNLLYDLDISTIEWPEEPTE